MALRLVMLALPLAPRTVPKSPGRGLTAHCISKLSWVLSTSEVKVAVILVARARDSLAHAVR